MLRFVFALLLLIHGLIHLLGFVNEWKLAAVQFSGKTLFPVAGSLSKTFGVLWLLAALLFVFAAGSFFWKNPNWWMMALAATALSQLLIVVYWPDARFGTIANLVILLVSLPALGAWKFDRKSGDELRAFLAQAGTEQKILAPAGLDTLPPVVQKWLHRAGAVGKTIPQTVRLRQTGEMCTQPGGKWMPFEAEQFFTTDPPGFYWKVAVDGGPFLHLTGRDRYAGGHGEMFIQAYSLFNVANTSGPETDQGSLLRYLAEVIWFPPAALNGYIRWEALDGDTLSARATMRWGDLTASGIYHFDANGDAVGFEADRYMAGQHGQATLERWQVRSTAFCEFSGLRVPCRGEATWKLKTGDFTWLKYAITEIAYDPKDRAFLSLR